MRKLTPLILSFLILMALINLKAPSLYLGKPEYQILPHATPSSLLISQGEPNFDFNLEAQSALVMRINDEKIIFEKNSQKTLPLASLTKLMTALVVEKIKGKQKDFEILVPITTDALLQEGDEGLFLNEVFKSAVMRDIMLLGSSNDAAYALAQSLDQTVEEFVERMNLEAENLGLLNTVFFNPTGLDVSQEEPGAIGTASDLAKLALSILKDYSYIFDVTTEKEVTFLSENNFSHKIENTNELTLEIPGLIGGKTGFSDLAGGNLLIIADLSFNEPYLFIVLGSGFEGRFKDMKSLYQAVK